MIASLNPLSKYSVLKGNKPNSICVICERVDVEICVCYENFFVSAFFWLISYPFLSYPILSYFIISQSPPNLIIYHQILTPGTAIKVESEIYLYRTKCGKYNTRKSPPPVAQKRNENNDQDAPPGRKDDDQKNNPRKVFSTSLDQIWLELASSGKGFSVCNAL